MADTNGKTRVENFVDVLRVWQSLERTAVNDMAEIVEQTENPFVRMIMEIIGHDSIMHHRVQQFLIDTVTQKDVSITREDVAAIWDKIEEHDKVERKTIELATELRDKAWSPVHKQLLDYLLTDEQKHDKLLDQLGTIKKGMDQASGG